MKKSVGRKIVIMLSVLGLLVILASILNSSALRYVADYNSSAADEVDKGNLTSRIEVKSNVK